MKELQDYVSTMLALMRSIGVSSGSLRRCGYVGYQEGSLEGYKTKQQALSEWGDLVGEEVVGERHISVFKLITTLPYAGGEPIDCLVISTPKGGVNKVGFTHIEYVVPNLKELVAAHPGITFNTENIDRKRNPNVKIELCGEIAFFDTIPLLGHIPQA